MSQNIFFDKISGGAQDAENGRTRGTLLRGWPLTGGGGVAATEPRHGERAAAWRGLRHGGGRDGAAAWRTGCGTAGVGTHAPGPSGHPLYLRGGVADAAEGGVLTPLRGGG